MTARQRRSKAKVKRAHHKRVRVQAQDSDQCECNEAEAHTCIHYQECLRDAAKHAPLIIERHNGNMHDYHFTKPVPPEVFDKNMYGVKGGEGVIGVGTQVHQLIERGFTVEEAVKFAPVVTIYDLLQGYANVLHRKAKRKK